jgi:hypothetical protein
MNRHAWGAILAGFLGGVGGAIGGCNFIVGVGDYSVGADASILHAEAGKPGDGGGDGKKGSAFGGRLGDPCSKASDCMQGTCVGEWCSTPCTSNSACGSNSLGNMNACVPNSLNENVCVPGCTTPAGTVFVCTAPKQGGSEGGTGTGIIGDPCQGTAPCAVGTCNGSWCEEMCSSATDKSCGDNGQNIANSCAASGESDSGYFCFPGCKANNDCTPYVGTTCSPNVAGSTTSGYSCSDTYGVTGDPCADDDAGGWSACTGDEGGTTEACNGTWCTVPCTGVTDNTSCGSSTTGQPNHCVSTTGADGGTEHFCFPGCTSSFDCSPYPDTFCEPVNGGGTGFICSRSQGQIGDPCSTNADCTQGTCLGDWCSEPCSTEDASTGCGMNNSGMPNYCVFDVDKGVNANRCFPSCKTTADCNAYAGTECIAQAVGSVCGYNN